MLSIKLCDGGKAHQLKTCFSPYFTKKNYTIRLLGIRFLWFARVGALDIYLHQKYMDGACIFACRNQYYDSELKRHE
jgi:hypothetical protein